MDLRIALYQPDIAGNTGTILRMAACLGIAVDIIEPAGFDLSDRTLKRAGMDYLEMAALTRHLDFARFEDWRRHARPADSFCSRPRRRSPYTKFAFAERDVLLFGRESAGVPDHVRDAADEELLIPMPGGGRSLNVALAAAMAAGEAVRQLARNASSMPNAAINARRPQPLWACRLSFGHGPSCGCEVTDRSIGLQVDLRSSGNFRT